MKKQFLLILALACIMFSCKPDPVVPTLKTTAVTEITEATAKSGGDITADGGAEVTSRGVCWSKNQNPTINDSRTDDGKGVGTFVSNMSDLEDSTTYYLRAYAINSAGIAYGEEVSFMTLAIDDDNDSDDDSDDDSDPDDDSDDDTEILLPTITTSDVTHVTETSAVSGGNVTEDGGAEVTARGVCWSTEQNPTIENHHTTDGNGTGSYTSNLKDLNPNTKYYVRAYATNEKGTAYGEEKSFTTLENNDDDENTINGYEYVDLGLPSGLKWASYNIGATTATEAGDFFAWGELEPKAEYITDNCSTYAIEMGNITASPQFDAARAKWGSTWRMPTYNECLELVEQCSWKWTEVDGVKGNAVTGPNGNTIFLPAAGFRQGDALYMNGVYGYIWCGTSYANELNFYAYNMSYFNGPADVYWENRSIGQNIRPVSGNNDGEDEISLPTISTSSVYDIKDVSAVCGGNVSSDGGAIVTAKGVCWNTTPNPTIGNSFTNEGIGVGEFTSNITELIPNTIYYVRAYATNAKGTAYGEEETFTTLNEIIIELPTVVTLSVADITETTALAGGNVTSDGGAEVISRGVCWSTNQNPSINDGHTNNGTGVGEFSSQITGLNSNTTYYVRAYATNEKGTAYGETMSFTTSEPDDDGLINGYEYVDLGLPSGVKWAKHNVGASVPSQAGNYYAWGEIVTKTTYTEANCTTYQLNMEDISGNPQYDVARSEWGSTWRMPTKEEYEELMNVCTWTWEVVDGTGCKKVTGPNGNYIYMPVSGYQYGTSFYMQSFGYYWTSTPISTYENFSYDFFFDMELNLSMGFDDRCYGQAVRPVSF